MSKMGSGTQAVDQPEFIMNLKVGIIMWLVAFHGGSRELFFVDMLGGRGVGVRKGGDFNYSFFAFF